MASNYTIMCYPRTGSNYLVTLLEQHDQITAHNELFHKNSIYRVPEFIHDPAKVSKRDSDPIAFLKTVLSECRTPVCGFKYQISHHRIIGEYVMHNRFKIIILKRENVLAQYSSMIIAHQTAQWMLKQGDTRITPRKLIWNESDFDKYRFKYEKDYADLIDKANQMETPWMYVSYTDLFIPQTIQNIFRFLGVSENPTLNLNTITKQNSSHIAHRFTQTHVIKRYLAQINRQEWAEETVASSIER